MGRPEDIDPYYIFKAPDIDWILTKKDKEDGPLEKFKFQELYEGTTMHICSKETLKKYIIDPMGGKFPIFLTNTITLTEKMVNNFCDMTVVVMRKRGTGYSDYFKKEVINYQVNTVNTALKSVYQNNISNYVIPEILFEEYWKKKEEYSQAKDKHYSHRSKSLNKETEFFKELEQLINDKDSIIYEKHKYIISEEDSFFDGYSAYMNIYYAVPVDSPANNLFVYSPKNQERLLNLLGFNKKEYVNVNVQLMNKYIKKRVKNSCFPHIFENMKFCIAGVFVSTKKVPYIALYIGYPEKMEVRPRIDRTIVLPFYMVKKYNQEMFYDKSKEMAWKIMNDYAIEPYQFFEIFYHGHSSGTIYYFNSHYNLRAIRYPTRKTRMHINNKLSDKIVNKILNKLVENKNNMFEVSKVCSNGDLLSGFYVDMSNYDELGISRRTESIREEVLYL